MLLWTPQWPVSRWLPGRGSSLTGLCPQYQQLPDESFTSAVVLALVLAALFGLVYLLIIPQ